MQTEESLPEKKDCTGIIFAGGKSSRMGMDKGLVLYKGKPMISYSIDLLSLYCSRILLSASIDVYDSLGLERVPDILDNIGPISGLLSCLRKSTTEINICLPCDVPEIPSDVIKYLLRIANENKGKCIIPLTPKAEPLIAVYPKQLTPVLESLISKREYKMTSIFEHFPVKYIPLGEFPLMSNKNIFLNINSRTDIQ